LKPINIPRKLVYWKRGLNEGRRSFKGDCGAKGRA